MKKQNTLKKLLISVFSVILLIIFFTSIIYIWYMFSPREAKNEKATRHELRHDYGTPEQNNGKRDHRTNHK